VTDDVLLQAFVYLCAGVLFVPVAKRIGLGAVLGYLLAGVTIGPWGLGLVGTEGHGVMHFAELGVVMMLFLVGLELRPALLWDLRRPILALGGLQVGATTLALAAVCFFAIIAILAWTYYDVRRGQAELRRLDIVLGALIVQEDEKLRALVENRIDDLLAQLSR